MSEGIADVAGAAEELLSRFPNAGRDDFADPVCINVSAGDWIEVGQHLHVLGFTTLDFLSAVDFGLHLRIFAAASNHEGRTLMWSAHIDGAAPVIDSLCEVFPSANWHERETAEMFGVAFTGHPDPRPLLLGSAGVHAPLRRDFPLAARLRNPWPGAAEPGEREPSPSGDTSAASSRPARRPQLPPGVRREWGES